MARAHADALARLDWPFAGFSSVQPWLPIAREHLPLSVASQAQDADSMLAFTRRWSPCVVEPGVARRSSRGHRGERTHAGARAAIRFPTGSLRVQPGHHPAAAARLGPRNLEDAGGNRSIAGGICCQACPGSSWSARYEGHPAPARIALRVVAWHAPPMLHRSLRRTAGYASCSASMARVASGMPSPAAASPSWKNRGWDSSWRTRPSWSAISRSRAPRRSMLGDAPDAAMG